MIKLHNTIIKPEVKTEMFSGLKSCTIEVNLEFRVSGEPRFTKEDLLIKLNNLLSEIDIPVNSSLDVDDIRLICNQPVKSSGMIIF